MPLKEHILEVINARGPQTDAELVKWCRAKPASVRRTRNDMVKAGTLFPQPPSPRGLAWGTTPTGPLTAAPVAKPPKAPRPAKTHKDETPSHFVLVSPEEATEESSEKKPDRSKWRMTDFTF